MRKIKKIIAYSLPIIVVVLYFSPKGMGITEIGYTTVSSQYKCLGFRRDTLEEEIVATYYDGSVETEQMLGSSCFGMYYGTRCEVEQNKTYCDTVSWRGILKQIYYSPYGALFFVGDVLGIKSYLFDLLL